MYTHFVSFKGGNKKSLLQHKTGTIPLRDFSSFILCYFYKWMQTWQVYSYLILKNLHARIILIQILSKSIKQFLIYCHFHVYALFLEPAAILESQTAKNYNGFIQETFWPKVGSISTNGSLYIVIFMFMLFLVTVPGGHLG